MTDCPSFLSATHRLANFQFESSDALVNRPRDEQNCKHKRDSATGYGEDHKVMVCKKHGVPSDAPWCTQRQRWCFNTQVRRALLGTRRYLGVPHCCWAVCWNASGGSLFPFRHTLLRELVVEACMSYA